MAVDPKILIDGTVLGESVAEGEAAFIDGSSKLILRDITEADISDLGTYLAATDIASGTITARADDINFSGGSDGDVLTVQADGSLALETPAGGGGGLTVGTTAIASGAANRVLYESSGNVLTQSANLTFGTTNTGLAVTAGAATTVPFRVTAHASQSANVIEALTSGGGNLVRVNVNGDITVGRFIDRLSGRLDVNNSWTVGSAVLTINSGFTLNTGTAGGSLAIAYDSAGPKGVDIRTSSGNNTLTIGGANSASPAEVDVCANGGSGTNIAGAALLLAGGRGTGTGAAGVVNIQTAPAGSSGSTLNALATALRVDADTTAGNTRLLIYDVDNATLERVTVGAADSGGSGYKLLRIPN